MKKIFSRIKRAGMISPGQIIAVLLFVIIFCGSFWGFADTSRAFEAESLKAVKEAVVRCAVQCYAVEGRYPPSLDYLAKNYGLVMQTDKYIYDYTLFADNLMPSVNIMLLEGGLLNEGK